MFAKAFASPVRVLGGTLALHAVLSVVGALLMMVSGELLGSGAGLAVAGSSPEQSFGGGAARQLLSETKCEGAGCDDFDIGGGECKERKDCNKEGECEGENPPFYNATGKCVCENNYGGETCDILLKSKLVSFLFAFFLGPYGVMRFYLGYIGIGILKILLTFMPCVLACVNACCLGGLMAVSGGEGSEGGTAAISIIVTITMCCSLCATLVFWLVDWILILSNGLPDADGNPLAQDM